MRNPFRRTRKPPRIDPDLFQPPNPGPRLVVEVREEDTGELRASITATQRDLNSLLAAMEGYAMPVRYVTGVGPDDAILGAQRRAHEAPHDETQAPSGSADYPDMGAPGAQQHDNHPKEPSQENRMNDHHYDEQGKVSAIDPTTENAAPTPTVYPTPDNGDQAVDLILEALGFDLETVKTWPWQGVMEAVTSYRAAAEASAQVPALEAQIAQAREQHQMAVNSMHQLLQATGLPDPEDTTFDQTLERAVNMRRYWEDRNKLTQTDPMGPLLVSGGVSEDHLADLRATIAAERHRADRLEAHLFAVVAPAQEGRRATRGPIPDQPQG